MYNFSIGGSSKAKDPYNFQIGGNEPQAKGFGLTGSLSKGGGLTGGLSSNLMSSQTKKESSTYSSGFGGSFGGIKSVSEASKSAQATTTASASTKKSQPVSTSAVAKNSKQKKGSKTKFGEDIIPRRFGLRYDPPTIIMEYMVPTTGKLYHHKMKLKKLQKDTNMKDALEYLRKKHELYLQDENVSDDQLSSLIERLRKRLPTETKKAKEPEKKISAVEQKKATVPPKKSDPVPDPKKKSEPVVQAKKSEPLTAVQTNKAMPGKIEPLKKSSSLAPLEDSKTSVMTASTGIRGAGSISSSLTTGKGPAGGLLRANSVGGNAKNKIEDSEDEEEEEEVFKFAWSKKGAGSISTNKPSASQSNIASKGGKSNMNYGGDDDDEDEDDDYYQGEEDEEDDDDEGGIDYQTLNLNKLSNDELKKHKDKMENLFRQNSLKPGDQGFEYNVEEDFNPEESNEWDD